MTIQYDEGSGIPDVNGNKCWWLNDKLHRVDGPACEFTSGAKRWLLNGKRHRVDGPAIEWEDGSKSWYLYDVRIRLGISNSTIGSKVEFEDDNIGIVLKHIEGVFYEVLLGNKKIIAYYQESIWS